MHEQGRLGIRQRWRATHEHLASSERGVLTRPYRNRINHNSYITRQYQSARCVCPGQLARWRDLGTPVDARPGQLARRRDLDGAGLAAGFLAGLSPSGLAAAVLVRLFVVLARAGPAFAVPDLLLADDRLPADRPEPELPVPPPGWR